MDHSRNPPYYGFVPPNRTMADFICLFGFIYSITLSKCPIIGALFLFGSTQISCSLKLYKPLSLVSEKCVYTLFESMQVKKGKSFISIQWGW